MWAADGLVKTFGKKLLTSGVQRQDWWHGGEHEVSFAIHLETLELELYRGVRSAAETWKAGYDPRVYLTGTIDWVVWGDGGGKPSWVDDLKTGHWPVAPTSKQLLSYALVPWLYHKQPSRFDVALSITQWPIYPLDNHPKRKWVWRSALDMMEHVEALRWVRDHPDEVNPEPIYIGPWDPDIPLSPCAFCSCRAEMPTSFITNYRYNAAPHCWPGMMKRINEAS